MISVLRRVIIENNFKWSRLFRIDHYANISLTKTIVYNCTITNILPISLYCIVTARGSKKSLLQ